MNQEELTYHLINDYLNGKLQGVHLDKFKNDLKNDPEFAQQVFIQQQTIEAIKIHRKNQLKAILNDSSKTVYIRNEWGKKWTYASAAVVVFFISLFAVVKFLLPTTIDKPIAKEQGTSPEVNDDILIDPDNEKYATNDRETQIPPAPEVPIIDDSELEEDTDENIEITNGNEVAVAVMPMEPIPSEDEILFEKLIASKTFNIYSVSTIVERTESESKPKRFSLKKNEAEDDLQENSEEVYKSESKTKSLKVEFWESPINFQGYSYQSFSGLKLYGFNEGSNLQFKELDGRLYLLFNSKIYHISPTKIDDHRKLTPVTQPELLNILND